MRDTAAGGEGAVPIVCGGRQSRSPRGQHCMAYATRTSRARLHIRDTSPICVTAPVLARPQARDGKACRGGDGSENLGGGDRGADDNDDFADSGEANMRYGTYGKTGIRASKLGFGAMRLPVIEEGEKERVDFDKSTPLIRAALASGINFIDTHHNYHDSQSEEAIGYATEGLDRSHVLHTDEELDVEGPVAGRDVARADGGGAQEGKDGLLRPLPHAQPGVGAVREDRRGVHEGRDARRRKRGWCGTSGCPRTTSRRT